MWKKLEEHTETDEELLQVMHAVHFGWETQWAKALKPYYHFRAEITEIEGVLIKGTKVIVPINLQKEMLEKIHQGHLGIEKCQQRVIY